MGFLVQGLSSSRRKGITTSVTAGGMVLVLVGLLTCPSMLPGMGQAAACETGDSHEPMSDTRMSCCSSAEGFAQLAPTDAFSSRVLKSWSVALLHAAVTATPPRRIARRYVTGVPTDTADPPLFLRNASFLI